MCTVSSGYPADDPAVIMARRALFGANERDKQARMIEADKGRMTTICHFCGKRILKKGSHFVNVDYIRKSVCADCHEVDSLLSEMVE